MAGIPSAWQTTKRPLSQWTPRSSPARGHRLGVLIPTKNLGQRRLPVRTRRKVWRKPHHRPALERERPGRGRATQWPRRHGGLQRGLIGGMAHGQGHCGPAGPGPRLAAQPLLVTR